MQIIKYFQPEKGPAMTRAEFLEFWHSLEPEEMEYYRKVNLETGLLPD